MPFAKYAEDRRARPATIEKEREKSERRGQTRHGSIFMNSFGINARNWETKAGRDNMCYGQADFIPAHKYASPYKYSSVYVAGNRICWRIHAAPRRNL